VTPGSSAAWRNRVENDDAKESYISNFGQDNYMPQGNGNLFAAAYWFDTIFEMRFPLIEPSGRSMRTLTFAMTLTMMLLVTVSSAQADWWKDVNPFRPITPNWGPLIPHPKSLKEIFHPGCWGHPQDDCGAPTTSQSSNSPSPTYPEPKYPYYVIDRYQCRDNLTNGPLPDATVTTRGASCELADYAQPYYTRAYDPCTYRGDTLYTEWEDTERGIQGDLCWGWK
jgi:hypothetical protein